MPEKLELTFGESQIISITGNQSVTVSPHLNWSSSNEDIVTVLENGEITAIGYGKLTITATDGNKLSICEITVPQNATTVTIDNISLLVGEREPIKPMFYPTTATETEIYDLYNIEEILKTDSVKSENIPIYSSEIIEIINKMENSLVGKYFIVNDRYFFSTTTSETPAKEYSSSLFEYFHESNDFKKITDFQDTYVTNLELLS